MDRESMDRNWMDGKNTGREDPEKSRGKTGTGKRERMRHRSRWMFLIAVWSLVCFMGIRAVKDPEERGIRETFGILRAEPVEGWVEVYAPLNKACYNEEEKKMILTELSQDLGIRGPVLVEKQVDDRKEKVRLLKAGKEESTELSISTGIRKEGEEKQYMDQYFYACYHTTKKIDNIPEFQKKIKAEMKDRGWEASVNFNIRGKRKGKLSMKEKDRLSGQILKCLRAEETESIKEKELYTIYGYSSLLEDSVLYGDRRINLNLAFTYEEEKD